MVEWSVIYLSDTTSFLEVSLGVTIALYTFLPNWLEDRWSKTEGVVDEEIDDYSLAEILNRGSLRFDLTSELASLISQVRKSVRANVKEFVDDEYHKLRKRIQFWRSVSPWPIAISLSGLVVHAVTGNLEIPTLIAALPMAVAFLPFVTLVIVLRAKNKTKKVISTYVEQEVVRISTEIEKKAAIPDENG